MFQHHPAREITRKVYQVWELFYKPFLNNYLHQDKAAAQQELDRADTDLLHTTC